MNKKRIITISAVSLPLVLVMAFFIFTGARSAQFKKLVAAEPVAFEQKKNTELLQPLPYTLPDLGIDVGADSAILIDVSNGCVIWEKNADKVIPPASMTKLFAMYVVE